MHCQRGQKKSAFKSRQKTANPNKILNDTHWIYGWAVTNQSHNGLVRTSNASLALQIKVTTQKTGQDKIARVFYPFFQRKRGKLWTIWTPLVKAWKCAQAEVSSFICPLMMSFWKRHTDFRNSWQILLKLCHMDFNFISNFTSVHVPFLWLGQIWFSLKK